MATECWLGLSMGSDGSSTLWKGASVPLTSVVGALAPKAKVGGEGEGKCREHVINNHLHILSLPSQDSYIEMDYVPIDCVCARTQENNLLIDIKCATY